MICCRSYRFVIIFVICLILQKCSVIVAEVGVDSSGSSGAVLYPWETEASKVDQWTRTGQVNLTLGNFTIFHNTYSEIFVFKKGAIIFDNKGSSDLRITEFDLWQYNVLQEGSSLYTPAIIPLFGQADITSPQRGRLQYRESTNATLLQLATKDVLTAFPGLKNINLNWIFVVTWVDIAFWEPEYYYATNNCSCNNKRNTFQAVLTTDGIRSFVILNYNKITWIKSPWADGKGNGPDGVAQPMCYGNTTGVAGFDVGNSNTPLYKLPGSYTDNLMNITKLSNIGEPGKWVFRVDSNLQSTSCDFAEDVEQIRVTPSWVPALGSIPLSIKGPCLQNVTNVVCKFYDGPYKTRNTNAPFVVPGELVEEKAEVRCNAPIFYTVSGSVKVELGFTYHHTMNDETLVKQEKTFFGYIYIYRPYPLLDFHIHENGDVHLKWNPRHFYPSALETMLELNLVELDFSSADLRKANSATLKMTLTNSGSYEWPLGVTGFFRNLKSGYFVYLRQLDETTFYPVRINSQIVYTNYKQPKEKYVQLCEEWYKKDKGLSESLIPCSPRLEQVQWDWAFQRQIIPPTKEIVFLQRVPNANGSAQRCVYSSDGVLIVGPPDGGTALMSSLNGNGTFADHHVNDIQPRKFCCGFSGDSDSCLKYYDKRPSDPGTTYVPPKVAVCTGDPHITTLDSASYTFNGVGEFWMVKYSPLFEMQARMSQFIHPMTKVAKNASVFTAIAMHQKSNSEVWVQVEINAVGISVYLDMEEVNIGMGLRDNNAMDVSGRSIGDNNNNVTINKAGVSVIMQLKNSSTGDMNVIDRVTSVFSSGFTIDITTTDGIALNVMTYCVPNASNKGNISGLLGNFDGNATNDLKDPTGLQIPLNSSLADIHNKFGIKWRTITAESLFWYKAGKTHDDYQNVDFVPNFKPPNISALPTDVLLLCGKSRECLYDYSTTGSLSFANATKEVIKQYQQVVEALKKKPFPWNCPTCSSTLHYDTSTQEGIDNGHGGHEHETTTSKIATTTKKSGADIPKTNFMLLMVYICILLRTQTFSWTF